MNWMWVENSVIQGKKKSNTPRKKKVHVRWFVICNILHKFIKVTADSWVSHISLFNLKLWVCHSDGSESS